MKITHIESQKKTKTKKSPIEKTTDLSDDIVNPYCPDCGSENVYGISRVVGYFSVIGNWNRSKQAELKRRQKGNYWHEED
ncbi:MAG: hypothetical protein KAJ76_06135 [Candidatus Heimdallarchaeota archaeon]|nr:hypothetical protein [Candidatus Heimdallarchaeota archaeon]MCK5158951.1 hypothetical protein [Candidatus Heimdallarchaeota archaeon]MCK5298465.1 hypothetical protein [Candidatus Heimdallarchaeota archaeon]